MSNTATNHRGTEGTEAGLKKVRKCHQRAPHESREAQEYLDTPWRDDVPIGGEEIMLVEGLTQLSARQLVLTIRGSGYRARALYDERYGFTVVGEKHDTKYGPDCGIGVDLIMNRVSDNGRLEFTLSSLELRHRNRRQAQRDAVHDRLRAMEAR